MDRTKAVAIVPPAGEQRQAVAAREQMQAGSAPSMADTLRSLGGQLCEAAKGADDVSAELEITNYESGAANMRFKFRATRKTQ